MRQWPVFLSLFLIGLLMIALGAAWVQEKEEDAIEDENVRVLLNIVRYNRDTIEASRSMLAELQTNPKARPLAFDACAGASIVDLMREDGGHQIPLQEYEIRCRKAQEEKTK